MAHPESLARCLFCHSLLTLGDLAVFRTGEKIAHVRCWRPANRSGPSHHVDGVAGIDALSAESAESAMSELTSTRSSEPDGGLEPESRPA
jgi:hypothetical protein